MTRQVSARIAMAAVSMGALVTIGVARAQDPPPKGATSFSPVDLKEPFETVKSRMSAAKAGVMKRQMDLLAARYDLADRPAAEKMTRGKALQDGVRVRLKGGMTWDRLGAMEPEAIRPPGPSPTGSCRCPTPTIPKAG